MNKADRDHFDELIIKANQSGKQETSKLFQQIENKIDSINETLNSHTMEIHSLKREVEGMKGIDENFMKLHVEKEQQEQRKASDDKYAIKIVEKIVFWAVSLVGIAFFTALISQVIPQ